MQEHGLSEHVKLLGYCTNLEKYQQIADVSVSCSRREGLPLNIVEAMLSGTPVVATDNRGHRELIHDGENGAIVPFDDGTEMADKIAYIFSDNQRFVENASLSVKAYEASLVTKELENIYAL